MTTYNSQTGISVLFASATLGELLYLFMLEPEREYYQRELQRLSGAHLRQLQRDLERLQRSGMVASRIHGNRTYYRAVPAHPAFADLRAALMKTMGIGSELGAALAGLGGAITLAFVFGSFARGDEGAQSDVDVLIVGSATRREVAAALADAARSLGREVNPVILTPTADLTRRWRAGDHFVISVLAGPRMWLVGDDDSLAALA
jgi:predicted nucleotidyltransferase